MELGWVWLELGMGLGGVRSGSGVELGMGLGGVRDGSGWS